VNRAWEVDIFYFFKFSKIYEIFRSLQFSDIARKVNARCHFREDFIVLKRPFSNSRCL